MRKSAGALARYAGVRIPSELLLEWSDLSAQKHHLQVTDTDFERAAGMQQAVQKAVQKRCSQRPARMDRS